METSLLLLIIGFIVVAFLIFKFIKKVVVAVVSIVLLFVVLVGAVIGLVVLDMNQLMENQNYDVQIVYEKENDYALGVALPIENKEPNFEEISSVSEFNLNNLNVDDISKEDNLIVVVIPDESFEKLVTEESYDLSQIQGFDANKLEGIDLTLTKAEVITILNSEDGVATLVAILFAKNEITGPAADILRPAVESELRESLAEVGLSFREAMFIYVIGDSVNSNEAVVSLFEDYKNGHIEVYPDRLSFKVLRMLPIDTVKNFIFGEETEEISE